MNDAPLPMRAPAAVKSAGRRVRLLGQPQLEDYLDFVREKVVGGADVPTRRLVDEWRAANDYYYDLEQTEAGLADEIDVRELDGQQALLAERLFEDPRFAAAFDDLPTTLELVELDRLVVCQQSVSLDFAEDLQARLGRNPDPERLFRFCQNVDRTEATVTARKLDEGRFLFSSESSDFRAQEPALFGAAQVETLTRGSPAKDPVSAMLGVAIGYGSNFLHAVRADDRLILQNGYHRAYALRALGQTHAVCAVQTVTRRDELKLAATDAVIAAPEFYCRAARPPLLKDYFDPRIAKAFDVRKMTRMIEVVVSVREFAVVE